MGLFGVVRGHSRSLKIAPLDRAQYEFLLAFNSNHVPILYRFWDIARYWSKIANLNLPHLYLASPLGVTPSEFRRDFWRQKLESMGSHDPAFSRFGTVPACDIQTDGSTDTRQQHIPC